MSKNRMAPEVTTRSAIETFLLADELGGFELDGITKIEACNVCGDSLANYFYSDQTLSGFVCETCQQHRPRSVKVLHFPPRNLHSQQGQKGACVVDDCTDAA